ncbi:protein bassoon isoform X1 [Coregonus clupeaformis]|uniref:protein bassoon isoform X1 n=1 Tax=Coregonus clupeaformis TaxID=59861 RepID=UPI001E1C490C|nr:protein bassoon isoform X1 [Coregonus clupeaformis]
MSGGLGEPSPVSHPSPKHQPMGSPRHQALTSQQPAQQPPFQKLTSQQQEGPRPMQPQQQKPQTGLGSGPFASTAAKQPGDTKAPVQATPTPAIEPLKQPKAKEETMPKPEELVEPTIDTKPTQKKGEPITPIKEIKKSRYDETKNSTQDLSRSPQSLSDTGYSSDGISSSHSEIIGLIQEEEMKLSERGISGRGSPPSPSEITKLESSMRPLLESKALPVEERERERGRGRHHREQRPRSLSITPEAYDSDEELEDIVEEEEDGGDWESKREHKSSAAPKEEKNVAEPEPMTDEEFMRRQIIEMSADEDNEEEEEDMEEEDEEDEGYGYQKQQKTLKHISELTKEKRRLSHQSSSFEEDTKSSSDIYKCSAEEGEEGGLGGLRRFKTIELNNTNSYSRDMELNNENDLSLDREPELEMESLTGSPEERSRGEYSSTLPPTTSSYNSGTSPTSISSMEEDSDSSPSRRQRLEDAKQQRKARHRSHGPLLPTIEDSSEEDELREEEELLREQEKMRDLEQQRIRSTARKTKRDKEELRAQRRRERSKTPPSNLSPIEDASPTEELRQAAEMEELHRSSASEYSPQSLDSEAEGYESKLYKSGSEYNLPTFMSLYSPTEKSSTTSTTTAPSSSKPLKSAEEVYEEMMRKAELLQKQQKQQQQQQGRHNSAYEDDTNGQQNEDVYEYEQAETSYENEAAETGDIYEEIRQTSQNITKMHQSSALELQQQADEQVEIDDSTYPDKQLLDTGSAFAKLLEQTNDLLTPGNSPTQLSAPVSFSETGGRIPDVRVTQHYSKDVHKAGMKSQTGKNGITPVVAATTIAAYGVYSRDAVTISQTSVSQTMTTTQSIMYGRQTGGPATSTTTVSNVCSKIAEITQAYSQREMVARRVGESRGVQARDSATSSEHVIEPRSPKMYSYYKSSSPPLSPSASPTESPTLSPSRRAEISTQTFSPGIGALSAGSGPTSPVMAQGTQTSQRAVSPRLFRQQSSQHALYMGAEPTSPAKPMTVNMATSPLSSPTRFIRQSTFDSYSSQASPPDTPPYHQSPQHSFYRTQKVEKVSVGTSMVTTASTYSCGSMSMDNISLCRISSIPGTSRVEPGQMIHGGSVVDLRTVDLRTATNAAPIIMTAHGMDLTSLATETRKSTSGPEGSHPSTVIQPLIMNLNTQHHPHVMVSTATTVSVTVAASMFISQPQQPMVYGDPLQNRVDLGQGMGSAMCLSQNKPPPIDPSIPKIDAKLEDLSIQQQQLFQQQQKLQQQQHLLEQQLQQHHQMQQQSSVARYNLPGQMTLLKKDLLVSQTSNAPAMVSAISPAVAPDIYGTGGPLELKSKPTPAGVMNLAGGGPHGMMIQMEGAPQGGPVTQLVKTEEGQDAVDFTGGQIKAENQPACCDVVYRLPFGGSCVGGPFSQKPNVDEKVATQEPRPHSVPPLSYESDQEGQYQEFSMDGRKAYTLPFPGRLQPSMSDTNLAEAGLQSYHSKMDPHIQTSAELAVDLSTMKHAYEGGFLGLGMQYGSYTDLRHGGDITATALPIRRFNSLSNISSDYGYSPRDLANFQESNLAQYSATTAREISRMCAALNSMDRYGSNPELMQYGVGRGTGPGGRLNSMRQNMLYGPDGKPISHTQALTNMINARQASLRAMYPSAMRSADGMTYSTINTPIASTLPITTQPASVLRPLLNGVYRPLPTANMTPVPLASLTRMPVNPRMPMSGQAPYRYPAPNVFPSTTSAPVSMHATITTTQDAPIYLGKPSVTSSGSDPPSQSTVAHTSASVSLPMEPEQHPMNLTQAHLHTQAPGQPQVQPQSQPPAQPQHMQPQFHPQGQHPPQSQPPPAHAYPSTQSYAGPQSSTQPHHPTPPSSGPVNPETESEEERMHRQQEQLLQMERERVELEKLRQLRLQEELERERMELQRHREKEQMLVHREIQELQTIKEQVLQQQQAERENQLVMQKEQLAQQKAQLDQIQSLQQQLQQQLEEQKRQKTAAAVAAAATAAAQLDQSGQTLQPYGDQVGFRSLPNSSSDMCLRNNEEQMETRTNMRKQNSTSMPRLRDGMEGESVEFYGARRIVDSCVQTDDEEGEERYIMSRRRRNRRSVDRSVQTDDDEEKVEWEQPVRRRRSRFSRHSDPGADHKTDAASKTAASSSIAIQTIRDCSCQTETDQLGKVSPAIHVTVPDPNKVEIVHYISGPERTQKGQSLACQTDVEVQSQGVVVPQLSVPTTVSPYSTGIQLVGSADPRQQQNRRRSDPMEISYQTQTQPMNHLHNESLSSLIRQPPKSPQVLYSPVSPVSPHRLLETSLSSGGLNKAHVTPQQKAYTAESPQRHPSMPRPIKNTQRSMSDPKLLSPTTDEHTKARLNLYQQQALQSQLAALQQSALRKVKRTLPSPPPEESHLPIITPALPQMYMPAVPSLRAGSRPGLAAKASLLKDLTHELKAVEQESTKLRKQQQELEEEEKEIDAKLRYLELGIHQRKETLVKERERRDMAYLRCMGDPRDYMSDSELNNLRLAAAVASYESNGVLTRPSTAPLSQFTSDLNTAAQFPPTSSFISYQSYHPQSQPAPAPQPGTPYQTAAFNQPPYPSVAQAAALPQPTPLQTQHLPPSYQTQGSFPSHTYPQSQPPYPTEQGVQPLLQQQQQPSHQGFQPAQPAQPGQPPYPTHTSPYPSQVSYPAGPSQTTPYQPQADILTVHQRPRQTSLADLEHKMPTNYEVISNPTVVVTTTAQDAIYSSSSGAPLYGQYTGGTTMANTYGPYSSTVSSTYGQYTTTVANTYGQQYTSTPASTYGQYTTTTANTYGYTTTTASSYGQYTATVANSYGHGTPSDRLHSVDSLSTYAQDGLYGPASLEQNIPRNYVMCDDISELTKDGLGGMAADMHRSDGHGGRYMGESGPARGGSSYGRPEDELTREEDLYDHHGRGKSSYHPRGSDTYGRVVGSSSTSMGGGSSYYYDDYTKHGTQRTGVQKHASKSLAPAVMSTKRSKHRKQGMEQKISKFSPIEEARDVEADLASYTMSMSGGGSCTVVSRARKLQDDMAYGLRKSSYEQKRYSYPEEDERMYYTSGRSRSTGYGMDKISSRDYAGYRSRSYERDGDRDRSSYRAGYSRGRPPMRSQYSEEESPLSSMGVHVRASSLGPELYDSRSSQYYGQYGSSHSLPDVQDHMRDLPRTHVYKPDDSYIIDDMHCAVSDSEAYNLGQEETDWFEKPRDLRSGSRHYGSGGHSSSGRSRHIKHSYHDYDEPPEEDLWPQDEYGQTRHSSSSRDHRPHGSGSSGRHSSSRHLDEPRSSRSSKGHPKDPSMRHDSRQLSSSGKRGDSRSQGGYHSSDYSRDPSGLHHSQGRSSKSSSSHDGRTSSRKQQDLQGHPSSSSRGQGSSGRGQGSTSGPPGSRGQGPTSQQDGLQPGQRTQLQQQPQTSAARQTGTTPAGTTPGGQQPLGPGQAQQGLQAKPGQLGPGQASRLPQAGGAMGQLPPTAAPVANTPPVTAIGAKAVIGGAAQPAKTPQPPLTGIGSKAAPRPGGIGSAAAGQPGMEGESLLSKVLPGNPAEAAGKLGEAISGFGKKFTSLW